MDPITAAGVPIVIALTEVFKPFVSAKFYPLVALLLGVFWAAAYQVPLSISALASTVLTGVTVGLVATGLYAAGKQVVTTKAAPAAKPAAPAASTKG